ncbi:hypothetical protein J2T57_001257 [Natronocella acetinitrilica]|uniref:Uncharacterized protein n=1 Tax=Natronocella acetinitrilica TaxID=414046 RepID=A0AAE3G1M2_9GAMM|nr:hypothetical protein [Natronocella acetinitrilica]MCP1674155.1 hypothetical protein [Natronocella acetinitrilica]
MLRRKNNKNSKQARAMVRITNEAIALRDEILALDGGERAQVMALCAYTYKQLFGRHAQIRNVFLAPESAPRRLIEATASGIDQVSRKNGRPLKLVADGQGNAGAVLPAFVAAHVRRLGLALKAWRLLVESGLAIDARAPVREAWSALAQDEPALLAAFAALRAIEAENAALAAEPERAPTVFSKLEDSDWLSLCATLPLAGEAAESSSAA